MCGPAVAGLAAQSPSTTVTGRIARLVELLAVSGKRWRRSHSKIFDGNTSWKKPRPRAYSKRTRPDPILSGRSLLTLSAEPRIESPVPKAPTRFFGLIERTQEHDSAISVDDALNGPGRSASRYPASDED